MAFLKPKELVENFKTDYNSLCPAVENYINNELKDAYPKTEVYIFWEHMADRIRSSPSLGHITHRHIKYHQKKIFQELIAAGWAIDSFVNDNYERGFIIKDPR